MSSMVSFQVPGSSAMIAAAIGDPDGTRTVTSIVALLVAAGIALLVLARWLLRATRPDRELLAPLEVMGDRSWRRADPVWQRRLLHSVRPVGAQPLVRSVDPPEIDASFDDGPSVSGFADLLDDAPAIADDAAAASDDVSDGSSDVSDDADDADDVPDGSDAPASGAGELVGRRTVQLGSRPGSDDGPVPGRPA